VNAFGPLQLYEEAPAGNEVRLSAFPAQIGLLLAADATGLGLTVTAVVAVEEQPVAAVTVTVYVPVAAVVAFAILGF
jgi:hypothetical protein